MSDISPIQKLHVKLLRLSANDSEASKCVAYRMARKKRSCILFQNNVFAYCADNTPHSSGKASEGQLNSGIKIKVIFCQGVVLIIPYIWKTVCFGATLQVTEMKKRENSAYGKNYG